LGTSLPRLRGASPSTLLDNDNDFGGYEIATSFFYSLTIQLHKVSATAGMSSTPTTRRPTRGDQPSTSGLGIQFESPVKRRNKKKTTTYVIPPGNAAKRRRLLEKLARLKAPPIETTPNVEDHTPVLDDATFEQPELPNRLDDQDFPLNQDPDHDAVPVKRRILPDHTAYNLYDKWTEVLPGLIDPLLVYMTESAGKIVKRVGRLHCECLKSCNLKTGKILCLFYDRKSPHALLSFCAYMTLRILDFESLNVVGCECQTILQVLVANGLFPTSPTSPRMAVSIDLLNFYHALFERSCEAINALAAALNTFYNRRGFILLNRKVPIFTLYLHIYIINERFQGQPVQDAFRRGLGYAVQWYDNLQLRVEQQVDAAIKAADEHLQIIKPLDSASTQPPHRVSNSTLTLESSSSSNASSRPPLIPGQCARILQERCPACFAGTRFGRSFDE
jgi:CxC1 like cysteine cluster associated with KDZ transposases